MSKEKMKKYSKKYVFDDNGDLLSLKKRTFKTNEGYTCEIINAGSKTGYVTCKIKNYEFESHINVVKKGNIKYPYHPSIYDKGFHGVGKYKANYNKKRSKSFNDWKSMLQRAYSTDYHNKYPTYKDTTVCDEWHNFQTFAKWHEKNYIDGYHLDKDILSTDQKIYSPQTCVYIPKELNAFMINIEKRNKNDLFGITFNKKNKKWDAQINDVNSSKKLHIGSFINKEEALKAYKLKRIEFANIWKERMKNILPINAINNIA